MVAGENWRIKTKYVIKAPIICKESSQNKLFIASVRQWYLFAQGLDDLTVRIVGLPMTNIFATVNPIGGPASLVANAFSWNKTLQ